MVVASSAAARLDPARAWLARAPSSALVVGPSHGAVDDLLASVRDLPGAGFLDVHSRTLLQLAAELATPALAEQGLLPVRELALDALAARAIARVESRAESGPGLEYLQPVADAPGLPRALRRTLEELRAFGVEPDRLVELGPGGRDLAALLRTFVDQLEEGKWVDSLRLLQLATEAATGADSGADSGAAPPRHLLGRPLLILDRSPDSPTEETLLRAVIEASPDVLAVTLAGDVEGIARLARALELEPPDPVDGGAPEASEASEASEEGRQSQLVRARRHLFESSAASPEEEPGADDDSLVFFSAPGEDRECVEIARHLLGLARAGVPFDACAVALRQPEVYAPLLEEAFARARIPCRFSRGSRRPDPAGRAFLALLACAEENLSAVRFGEYLSLDAFPKEAASGAGSDGEPGSDGRSELVPWVEPEGDQLVFASLLPLPGVPEEAPSSKGTTSEDTDSGDRARLPTPRHWEQLIGEAGILDGRERWKQRLDGIRAELTLQKQASRGVDRREEQRLEAELAQVDALSAFALPLVDRLAELPEAASWGRWIEPLEKLAVRALGRPERVLAILDELRPMHEVGPVGLGEVRRVLEPRLGDLRAEPLGRRFGKVWIAELDELRGRSFHAVFLPGLAEGTFPRRAYEDPLLLDEDRLLIGTEGDPAHTLPTLDERVERERRLLRIAVGAAETRLVVSYPSLDSRVNRGRVPSFYALDLLRAAEGRLPDLRHLERRAAEASPARLGWPAPRDPALAIDDTEFDLATLVAALDPDSGGESRSIRGRGRYLLETSAHLGRSLRHRYRRYALRTIGASDGLVTTDADLHALLARHRPRERAWTAETLESFAACPYRFYLRGVLGLRPRDRPRRLEQVDPATRDQLFHEVVHALLAEQDPKQAEEALFLAVGRLLDLAAAHYEEELAPALPRVWRSEVEGLRMDLRGWIRHRFESDPAAGPAPSHRRIEPIRGPEGVRILDHFRVRAAIDAVETTVETKAATGDEPALRTVDWETGPLVDKPSPLLTVGGGEMLRPLVHALAAEAVLGQPVTAGRLVYATRRGGYRQVDVRADERARKALGRVLETVDDALARGFLPSAPREGACEGCDFAPICGPSEEARMASKDHGPLDALDRLRRLP